MLAFCFICGKTNSKDKVTITGVLIPMISTTLKRSGLIIGEVATLALFKVQFAAAAACPAGTSATDGNPATGAACAQPAGVSGTLSIPGLLQTVSNVLIFGVGAISVIVLIIGGLRYVVSGGNATQVQGAKNTILYAIVGIVVAVAAFALVNFVFQQLGVQ
jgi:hypothetical protein